MYYLFIEKVNLNRNRYQRAVIQGWVYVQEPNKVNSCTMSVKLAGGTMRFDIK